MKNLTINDIQKFAEIMHAKFEQKYPTPEREMAYGRMTKITEEVGEMADAVLSHFKRQRSDKEDTSQQIGFEMADVILAVMLLAKALDVNIEEALKQKMEKILNRDI